MPYRQAQRLLSLICLHSLLVCSLPIKGEKTFEIAFMGQTNTNNPQRNCYSSCDERPVRSLHPFGLGYVSRPIYVITTQHSLSLTSLTCIPNSITYALLAFSSYPRRLFQTVEVLWTRQKYRLTKFHYYHTSSEDTICPPAVL